MSDCIQIGGIDFTIDGFSFVKKLGEGASATVWLVRAKADDYSDNSSHNNRVLLQNSQDLKCVVKIFHKLLDDGEGLLRFDRECKSLSSLRHKNIVHLEKWGSNANVPWVMFAYEEAVTLHQWIRNTPHRSVEEMEGIFSGLCSALTYVHGKEIIHRDLKPENILIRKDLTPVIIDFGMAKSQLQNTVETATGIILGTPAYMAPEIITGQSVATRETDIYSLTMILYELIEGQPMYRADNLGELLRKVCKGDHAPPRKARIISPSLETLITNALSLDPSRRNYKSVNELHKAVLAAFDSCDNSSAEMQTMDSAASYNNVTLLKRNESFRGQRSSDTKGPSSVESQKMPDNRKKVFAALTGLLLCFIFGALVVNGFLSPDSRDILKKLALKEDFVSLGNMVLTEDFYLPLGGNKAYANLAGKIEAIRIFSATDPVRALDLYLDILSKPNLRNTDLAGTLFGDLSSMVKGMPLSDQRRLNKEISRIVSYERASHKKEDLDLYDAYVASFSDLERVAIDVDTFLTLCSEGSYSVESKEELLKDSLKFIDRSMAFIPDSKNLTLFTDSGDEARIKRDGAFFYLKDTQSQIWTIIDKVLPDLGIKDYSRAGAIHYFELPLTLVYLTYVHFELEKALVLERKGQLANDSQFLKAWGNLCIYLGKNGNPGKGANPVKLANPIKIPDNFGKPLVPFEIFSGPALSAIVRVGSELGDMELLLNCSQVWTHHYRGESRRRSGLDNFRTSVVACNMFNKCLKSHGSIDAFLGKPEEVAKDVESLKMSIPEFDFRKSAIKYDNSLHYLSFMAAAFTHLENSELSTEFYSRFLERMNGVPVFHSALNRSFLKLFYYQNRMPPIDRFLITFSRYISTLDKYPLFQCRLLLVLLGAHIPSELFSDYFDDHKLTKNSVNQAGEAIRKALWFSEHSELNLFSSFELGRAAWATRVRASSKIEGDGSIFDDDFLFKSPPQRDESETLKWWAFVSAFLSESSPSRARTFIKNELPSLKENLMKLKEGWGPVFYSYILSQGLRRWERSKNPEDGIGAQKELALELVAFIEENVASMNREAFVRLCPEILANMALQKSGSVATHFLKFRPILDTHFKNTDILLLNRAYLFLVNVLSKDYHSDKGSEVARLQPLISEASAILKALTNLPSPQIPLATHEFALKRIEAFYHLGRREEALKIASTLPEAEIPPVIRELFKRIQIKIRMQLLSTARITGDKKGIERELDALVPLIKEYETLHGAKPELKGFTRAELLNYPNFGIISTLRFD